MATRPVALAALALCAAAAGWTRLRAADGEPRSGSLQTLQSAAGGRGGVHAPPSAIQAFSTELFCNGSRAGCAVWGLGGCAASGSWWTPDTGSGRSWRPPGAPLRDLSAPGAAARCLGEKWLVLVGDSVTRETFYVLSTVLGRDPLRTGSSAFWRPSPSEPSAVQGSWQADEQGKCKMPCERDWQLPGGGRLSFVFIGDLPLGAEGDDALERLRQQLRKLREAGGGWPPAAVLFNHAHWPFFHGGHLPDFRARYARSLRRFRDAIRGAVPPPARLMWLGQAPAACGCRCGGEQCILGRVCRGKGRGERGKNKVRCRGTYADGRTADIHGCPCTADPSHLVTSMANVHQAYWEEQRAALGLCGGNSSESAAQLDAADVRRWEPIDRAVLVAEMRDRFHLRWPEYAAIATLILNHFCPVS
eukprot:TRINITY_DN39902_c0_g1_i1.p1 TRINITY_DN39902_c0_g1~~TRINITY_DN39902_c0_g1_i1.p1  ORF type:complete len:418 (+),score=99.24 TRINITY_DN39902_c0_g1_i1:71-1324(+)